MPVVGRPRPGGWGDARGRAPSVLDGVFRADALVGALVAAWVMTVAPMEWALLTAAGLTGVGQSVGPVLVASVVGVAGVGVAAVSVGALGVAGAGWLWYWWSSASKERQP